MEFSEEQLIELAFQVLKNIQYNNSMGLSYKGMLRMENINFNQMGRVKVQEMIHVFLEKYSISQSDLIYLSPEMLKSQYSTNKRSNADELLSHPVFRQQNQIYLCQQIEFSQPFTLIEKQYLKQIRQQADSEYIRGIGIKKLYEITILKALESNQHDNFLEFIQEQLDKKKQNSIQLSNNGVNNRRLPILSRLSMNDEQNHSNSKSKLFDSNKQTDSFEFLVLKPDLQQAQVYLLNYNASSIDDWSTVEDKQSNNQQTIKDSKQNMIQQNHQDQSSFSGLVSDSMSVQSSFMDKISSIFSFGIAARQTPSNNQAQQQMQQNQNMKSNSTDKNSQQSISPDKFSRQSQNDKNSKLNSELKQNNPINNKPDMIKRYLKLCHLIENHSISITKISQIVRKNQDILSQCKFLRKKVWIRLLPDTNIFYQNILDFETELDLKLGNVSIKESSQVWNDIKRCEHFHPLLRNDLIKKQIHRLILVFLDLNEDTCCYVQGLDSIAVVLYTEYAKIGQEHLIITMMKQIFTNYLRHFIDKETNNLSFKYPCILVKRLLAFYEPELYVHFNEIDFQHDMYLVCWVMTLFAHTISIDKVVNIWTDLFCERVEYLFFINIAILQQIKDKLLLLDLNSTLIMINNIQGLIDVDRVLIKARDLMRQTPESFIQSDFIFDLKKQNALNNMDLLRENEYFAQRWWELEYLDYRDDIELPLIQVDNAININNPNWKKNKLFIDIRDDFQSYYDIHLKGSYYMDGSCTEGDEDFKIFAEFLQMFHDTQGDTLFVFIGDREQYGHVFAQSLIKEAASLSHVCILKGGIDALCLEHPKLMRKGGIKGKSETSRDFMVQYERFIKKAKQAKILQAQTSSSSYQQAINQSLN
eukprot:403349853